MTHKELLEEKIELQETLLEQVKENQELRMKILQLSKQGVEHCDDLIKLTWKTIHLKIIAFFGWTTALFLAIIMAVIL